MESIYGSVVSLTMFILKLMQTLFVSVCFFPSLSSCCFLERVVLKFWMERKPHSRLDHNDPSKPSHRLTNGPEPSKTIESNGSKIKNHWKTIDGNGQTAKKHSMVMVSSKTIENLQWSLQNYWNFQWFPKNHWTCQWSSQINIFLKEWNYPVVTITILIWLFCSEV